MTANILVAGLINIETTLKIDAFPYSYTSVRYPFFGVKTTVSGVGYNISKALTVLGHNVRFLSLLGTDAAANMVRAELAAIHIDDADVLATLGQTPQSVILYDGEGTRSINTDLKDIQDQPYPTHKSQAALARADIAVLCNINFARPMLAQAQANGTPIATDVHAISTLDDAYNADYMRHAHILFQSHENLPDTPEAWVRGLWDRYTTPIAVVGLGAAGALLAIKKDNFMERVPAVYTRPVVNTIGAGDALFSAFVHAYSTSGDPYAAIRQAMVFASYKIGTTGAADGFLSAADLAAWAAKGG